MLVTFLLLIFELWVDIGDIPIGVSAIPILLFDKHIEEYILRENKNYNYICFFTLLTILSQPWFPIVPDNKYIESFLTFFSLLTVR